MAATMKDVAKLAGVSLGTVSRVVNNNTQVKEKTKKKVKAAIKELGYIPDDYARGLKTQRSMFVALILPTIWHPFFSEFAYYVETELTKRGYKLLICNSDGDAEKERKYIQMVKKNKIDGIIGITYSAIDQYVSANLPLVSIDRSFTEPISYVSSDNFNGGEIALDELLKHGATNLAYISGYSKYKNETTKRHDGFLSQAAKRGVQVTDLFVPEPITNLDDLLRRLFIRNPNIDGIFCVNDTMLMDVRNYLARHGKQVPEDIQMIGFDGIALGPFNDLGLSTIVQPVPEMAQSAVNALFDRIEHPDQPTQIKILPVSFKEGGTTRN
ncbi:LacI family DNA-binding transcriptional regulator [Lapidilactobacillus dextrinicus]|uniref:LacI family DNA-binding transcriptional regulator n=1 Tax=Lapidilactobacillus dextrinicus TaxID=51664 RepID=UPI0022DFCA5D|nr:LacI family DNA-binding transcriptional regulator [Lapidilactobacillus dextrinicus]